MLRISPFTPLFFNPSTDRYGMYSRYIQKFAPTDQILIEVVTVSEKNDLSGYVIDALTDVRLPIAWNIWAMNDTTTLYYYTLTGLDNGYYKVELNGNLSELFEVTDDQSKLAQTTLVQYSMKDNMQRTDCVFIIEGKQYLFDFRVPGGFKDSDWSFIVNNEQFMGPDGDVIELFSSESTLKIFTLGNAEGCPVWYAELLNRILSCNYVFFNGKRFVRNESSVPELNQILEGLNSYVFKISLHVIFNNTKIKFDNQYVDGTPSGGEQDSASLRLSRNILVTSPQTGYIKTGDILPQGMSYEDVFVTMLEKQSSARLTGRLSTANEVEYGTSKGYITYTTTRNGQGIMKKSFYDGLESNKLIFSEEAGGVQTAKRQLTGLYLQNETYTAEVIYSASSDGKLPELTLKDSISVNVRRKWFAGVCNTVPVSSSDVRGLLNSGLYNGSGTYKFNVGQWKMIAICIPSGTIKDLSLIAYPGNFMEDTEITSGPISISVEGANGSEAIEYKMWIVKTGGLNDPDTFTFKVE
ncbi:hypothetical protein [Bacteroides sp.]|uniref:hypothetical protein n=1 Tax=Bacteroides sp. TaxID=29523 RepID=UPI0026169261|nr:hypothetical protein [Bacteroides sp.]MDD3038813.1 hypothetical protein [Bacteroides sp.]